MSRSQRLGLIAFAAVVIVAAFVLVRPTEEGTKSGQPSAPAAQTETPPRSGAQRAEAKPRPPEVAEVRIRDGKPAGGSRTIGFKTGERGRIDVTSNTAGEVHLHGYDIERPVRPGQTTKLRFKADIEGIFELEDHASGQELASVKVSPR